jgi:hypothetical protein
MNFDVSTEVNLDMTVRITGRDQATGQDIAKLNALMKAVEDLGGTITLPDSNNGGSGNGNNGGNNNSGGWELTNATLENGVLTYTGGIFEEEGTGSTYNGLFAKKSLGIGESATVGFKFASADITYLAFAVDDGVKSGSYSDFSAVILQNNLAARLIAVRDWSDEHKVDLQDNTTYTARIDRTAIDTVVLSVFDLSNNLLKERIVTIAEADLKRIWLSTHFANVNTVFSTELTTQAK